MVISFKSCGLFTVAMVTKIEKQVILMMFFSFILLMNVSAKSSDMFIDYLTEQIYQGCYEEDILLKQGFIYQETRGVKEDLVNINWPYSYPTLRRIIQLFGEIEPYDNYFDGCERQDGSSYTKGLNGCDILSCNGHKLDINNYEYFWDDVRVDVPREEFKTIYGDNIETYGDESPVTTGDESPVTTGDNSPITQEEKNVWVQLFLSKGTIVGAILGLLLKILYDVLKPLLKKKLSRKKKTK